jgi:hypothetical protein
MNIIRIIKGHYNNLLSKNEELKEFRINEGCSKCPLFVDGWCSSKKGGCGCVMAAKASLKDAVCPLNVWANDWVNQDKLKEIQKNFNK